MHHPIFSRFARFSGRVPAGFQHTFAGSLFRCDFDRQEVHPERHVEADYPAVNEEYLEWIDVLEAVDGARGTFTMMELGAGFGRWLVNGARAARQRPGLACRLVGVEAEPHHFQFMRIAFRDNGLDPDAHRLLEAAVGAADGRAWFYCGRPVDWWGQALVTADHARAIEASGAALAAFQTENAGTRVAVALGGEQAVEVAVVGLGSLLAGEGIVDLIDLDVQGSELDVLRADFAALGRSVRRVHVGTHAHDLEEGLRRLFTDGGWRPGFDHPCLGPSDTPWGRVEFQDGVQSWTNPRLA